MEDHMHDEEDTLSLSDLHTEDNIASQEVFKANQTSSSSFSLSSSSFEQDFLGFFSEEWSCDQSNNTSPENIIFCGKQFSSKPSVTGDKTSQQLFRSNYDSFRFMRSKTSSRPSTPRSKSLPNRPPSSSSCKSKWQVFMFGFGSGKFPTTMDMSDIKSRQLRSSVDDGQEESGGRRSGNKGWWRLVDVLGCGGAYERDRIVVI